MQVRCTQIEWDTDGSHQENLPTTEHTVTHPREADVYTDAANALSDKFGMCVSNLTTEIVE